MSKVSYAFVALFHFNRFGMVVGFMKGSMMVEENFHIQITVVYDLFFTVCMYKVSITNLLRVSHMQMTKLNTMLLL